MKFKQKLFVIISVFLILVVSGAIYVNYKLDSLVARLNQPGVLYRETGVDDKLGETTGGGPSDSQNPTGTDSTGLPIGQKDGRVGEGPDSDVNHPSNTDIAQGAMNKANRPVEKEDLIKAGLIIIRRLDADEISYMYDVGMKEHRSAEEMVKVRKILRAKLTAEEIREMQYLGAKYGKNLKFLD